MFSNWETQNNADSKIVQNNINKGGQSKTEIKDWFKNKYHPYQTGYFKTEHHDNFGIHGEEPRDKFFNRTQKLDKQYSDNFDIGNGTTKTTNHIPGYLGNFYSNFNVLF